MNRTLRPSAIVLAAMLSSACSAKNEQPARTSAKERYSLAIVGYNYTNHSIDNFSVNGTGGGNLYVSSPTSGGGGTVCCTSYYPKIPKQKIRVRWQSGGCRYFAGVGADDRDIWLLHPSFKEADADVNDTSTGEPNNLEVHIYPDDKVEAYVTSEISTPRVNLDKSRAIDGDFPRCPNDKKPK